LIADWQGRQTDTKQLGTRVHLLVLKGRGNVIQFPLAQANTIACKQASPDFSGSVSRSARWKIDN